MEARPVHHRCRADVCPARPRQAFVVLFRLYVRRLDARRRRATNWSRSARPISASPTRSCCRSTASSAATPPTGSARCARCVHEPDQGLVLEVAFEGLQRSTRHKSGLAMRFPRINRLRWDKPPGRGRPAGAAGDHARAYRTRAAVVTASAARPSARPNCAGAGMGDLARADRHRERGLHDRPSVATKLSPFPGFAERLADRRRGRRRRLAGYALVLYPPRSCSPDFIPSQLLPISAGAASGRFCWRRLSDAARRRRAGRCVSKFTSTTPARLRATKNRATGFSVGTTTIMTIMAMLCASRSRLVRKPGASAAPAK